MKWKSDLRVDVGSVLEQHLDDPLEPPRAAEVQRRGQVVRLLAAAPAGTLAPGTVEVATGPEEYNVVFM